MNTTARFLPAAVVLGLLGSGALVWQASSASFTATTSTGTNEFTSGRVVLSNNSSGSALFNPTGLVPGATETKCVDVTYSGDVAASTKFYAKAGTSTDLAPFLDFRVDQIAAGATCDATATVVEPLFGSVSPQQLSTLLASNNSWATGLGTWTASSSDTRRYRFSYVLRDDNAAQGKTAQVALTWEARNT